MLNNFLLQNSPKLKISFKSKLFDILSKKIGTLESQELETAWRSRSNSGRRDHC